jgi:protein SCO1
MKLCASLAIACLASNIHAHQGSHEAPTQGSPTARIPATSLAGPKERAARLYFSDRRLITHHGQEVAFFSDVLKGKVVLVNSMYTHCVDVCSVQSFKLSQVQALLGEQMGKDTHLVSISVDPERDTPDVLNRCAEQFNAGASWTFLTGSRKNVDDVLRRLDQLARVPEAHTTLFIIGNVNSGHWIKLHPDSTPDEIVRHLRQLALENRGDMP